MDYQPIRPSSTSRILSSNTKSESLYWRKFKYPVFFKHDGPITSIHYVPFNQIPISANGQLESESDQQSQSQSILTPSSKNQYAITSSTKVQIYNSRNHRVKKTISRFKDIVSCSGFRWDGKLIAAGDHKGLVQVSGVE